jgi:glucan biosynthesis protein C
LIRFSSINLVILVTLTIIVIVMAKLVSWDSSLAFRLVKYYLDYLMTWLLVAICFNIFYRLCNEKSKLWSFLSDASYTFYLFHNLIVVILGMILIKLNVPSLPSILLIILIASSLCFIIHKYLILKFPVLRLMYNGKVA